MKIMLCGAGEIPNNPPPILVEEEVYCGECHNIHDLERCPWCNYWIGMGYGIIPGGMGSYKFCLNDDCDWVYYDKEEIEEG